MRRIQWSLHLHVSTKIDIFRKRWQKFTLDLMRNKRTYILLLRLRYTFSGTRRLWGRHGKKPVPTSVKTQSTITFEINFEVLQLENSSVTSRAELWKFTSKWVLSASKKGFLLRELNERRYKINKKRKAVCARTSSYSHPKTMKSDDWGSCLQRPQWKCRGGSVTDFSNKLNAFD